MSIAVSAATTSPQAHRGACPQVLNARPVGVHPQGRDVWLAAGTQGTTKECERTLGVLYWRALRVWCMDMISWPHFSVLNAQKSTTWPVMCTAQRCQHGNLIGTSQPTMRYS